MHQGVQTDAIYVTTNNAGSCWPTIERLAFKFTADCKYEIQVEKLFQNSKGADKNSLKQFLCIELA